VLTFGNKEDIPAIKCWENYVKIMRLIDGTAPESNVPRGTDGWNKYVSSFLTEIGFMTY